MAEQLRPTKKQRDILTFIEKFIGENGYSPSYREIMTGLNYTSVATVAMHVDSLIKRGHLRKRDHSARSIEVVTAQEPAKVPTNDIKDAEEKWLIQKVQHRFYQCEQASEITRMDYEQLAVLVGALRVLGLEGAAQSFVPKLSSLKKKIVIDTILKQK